MADPREAVGVDSAGVYFMSVAEFEGRSEPPEPSGRAKERRDEEDSCQASSG